MAAKKTIVAVLDDDPKTLSALARLLRVHDFEPRLFDSGDDFLMAANSQAFDCLLLDLHMPGKTGFDVLRAMASLSVKVPAIVITGQDEPGNAVLVRKLGAADYLPKPIDESTLLEAIRRVCPGSSPTGSS